MRTSVKSRLEDLLKSSGMTENELAKASGVEYTTIHRIIQGETTNPSKNTLAPIAKALNTNLDYLHKGMMVESELSILERALAKLEQQLDKKDAIIERLMAKVLGDNPNFPRGLSITGLRKSKSQDPLAA